MFPGTPAAEAALSVATRFCSPALLNHSVRSYLWAAHLGAARAMSVDAELHAFVTDEALPGSGVT